MHLLVGADLAADIHAGTQEPEEVLVDHVDLGAQLFDSFLVGLAVRGIVPDRQAFQHRLQGGRGQLLLRIAERDRRIAVGLDHQAVQPEVHRPLGQLLQILPVTGHMAWISEKRQFRIAGAEFDGDAPSRIIAVGDRRRRGKTAVDDAELADTGPVEAFQRTDPQVQVRVDRILDQHRHVRTAQGIGDLLHQERIGGGSGSDPYHVHPVLDALQDMLFRRDLRTNLHPEFFLDPFHPLQARRSDTFETARMGPGFPDACPENMDAESGQAAGGLHDLLLGFGAARSRDAHRPRKRKEPPLGSRNDIERMTHANG